MYYWPDDDLWLIAGCKEREANGREKSEIFAEQFGHHNETTCLYSVGSFFALGRRPRAIKTKSYLVEHEKDNVPVDEHWR